MSDGRRALTGAGLGYDVAGRTVLDGVDVHTEPGRVLAVRGPSGSGKSTLLALLGGLTVPTRGTVTLDGSPLHGEDPVVRRRIGLVLQAYGLVAALNARENVAVVLQAQGVRRAEIRERVRAALEEVGLAAVAGHPIEELSGGQQQRVAVARALVGRADILLADEPTAELDGDNRGVVMALLRERADAGAIVVLASHDPDVIEVCDDVLDLRASAADGRRRAQ